MSEHVITPEMIEAGREAAWRKGYISPTDNTLIAIFYAMESARLEGEEAARQERMKARQL